MVLWIGWIRGRGAPCKEVHPPDGGAQAGPAVPVLHCRPDREDDGARHVEAHEVHGERHMVQFLARVETAFRDGQTKSVNAAASAGTGAARGCVVTGAAARQSPSVSSKAVGAEMSRRRMDVSQFWKAGEPARAGRLMR